MSAYSNILNQAQSVAGTPWQNYGGEFVSPVNPQQYRGISGINQFAQAAQPTLGVAQNMAFNAAQPISYADIARYQNPWTQNVVGATEAQFNNQNVQQLQNVRGNAIAQGALGGDREAVAEAELANQQNLAQAPVIAGLESQGYTQGVNTALTEQQALASGAYSLGNLGVAAQTAGLGGAGAQIQAGGLEQQTQQAQDQALYQQWLASRAYPFQTTQWLAGLDTGVGSQMGGTSTTQGPRPSMWSQMAGLGLGGLGIMGQTGAFGSSGWLGPMASSAGSGLASLGSYAGDALLAMARRGGRINGVAGYDEGGAVSGGGVSPLPYASGRPWEPYAGGRGWVPTANMTHGQGAPRPPQAPQQDDPMRLGEQVAGLAKYFKAGQGPMQITPNQVPTSPAGTMVPTGVAPGAWSPFPDEVGSAAAIYRDGGVVRGYADGGMPELPDDLSGLVSPTAPARGSIEGVAQTYTPGLHDYFTAQRPPPPLPPRGYVGKVQPSDYDPYVLPALRDATTIAGAALPVGRAEALAEGVAPYFARGASAARSTIKDLMQGAGAAGGLGGVEPAYAGERPALTSDDAARLSQLDRDIASLTRQKQAAIGLVGRSRIGATAQSYDEQIAAKQAEIDRVRGALAQRQAEYDKAGRPLSIRDPEATSIMRYGGLGLGAVTGLAAGLKRVPAWHSALYGGIEGGLGAAAPTLIDLPMPKDTEAGRTARANIHSPDWYTDVVGPDALAGVAAGLGFHGTGHVIGAPFGKRAGVSPDVALPPATGAVRKWPTDATGIKMMKDSAGRWREQGTGQFIPKHLQPPSGNVVPMRAAEASGGAVRGYDDGGTVAPPWPLPQQDNQDGAWPYPAETGVAPPPSDSAAVWDAYPRNMTPQRHTPGDAYGAPVPASIRTNNPGAQWMGPVARQFGASTSEGLRGGNNAAVFPDPTSGAAAQFALWGRNYTGMPLSSAINKWSGGNSPRGYTDFVSRFTGLPPNTVLTPELLSGPTGIALMKAQAQWESGKPYPMTDAQWSEAQTRGLNSSPDHPMQASYRGNGVAGGYGDLVPMSQMPGQTGGAPQSGIDFSSNSKLWPSLMAAGFGMMASRSPYPLQAVGEGALTGMGAYTKSTELESARSMKQSEIQMQAEKLWQQNETERKKLALEAAKLERTPVPVDQFGRLGVPDLGHPGRFKDPVTGQPVTPLGEGAPSGSSPTSPMAPAGTQADGMRMISSVQLPLGKEEQAMRAFAVQANPDDVQRGQSTTPSQDEPRNWDSLKAVPEAVAREVVAIDQGLQPPPSPYTLYGGKSPRASAINNALRAFDPGYDYNSFRAAYQFGAGPLGTQIRAFNTAIYHLNSLEAIAKKLNSSDIPAANAVVNFIKTQLGHPEVTNLETARQFVGGEVIKAVVGTRSGEQERQEARKMFSPNMSLDQILGAADTDRDFMGGQLRGLKQQYMASTRRNDFEDRYLVPEARAALEGKRSTGATATSQEVRTYQGKQYRLKPGTDRTKQGNWEEVPQ